MDLNLQRMHGADSVALFGIRHFSPAGAVHAVSVIERLRPDCLLVELPADAQALLPLLLDEGTVPPVALVSWVRDDPQTAAVLPLASFSPEYRAIKKAAQIGAEIRFIDLPSGLFLTCPAEAAGPPRSEVPETDWELAFEHESLERYLDGMRRLSAEALGAAPAEGGLGDMRESYMRYEIGLALDEGFRRILVIAGAFHTERLARMPNLPFSGGGAAGVPTDSALIPYTDGRLGLAAPAYAATLHESIRSGTLEAHPERYLSGLAAHIRRAGADCPTSAVIDAARMARALAGLRGHGRPVYSDLCDAAECCMGAAACHAAEPTSRDGGRGRVLSPQGTLPLTTDFWAQARSLRLEPYLAAEARTLALDFRREAGLTPRRSAFLHRLGLLQSPVVARERTDDSPAHIEKWGLRFSAECDIHLAQAGVLGATVEQASETAALELLEQDIALGQAADLLVEAVQADLQGIVGRVLRRIDELMADRPAFADCAEGAARIDGLAFRLGVLDRPHETFDDLAARMAFGALLALPGAARCDRPAATGVARGISALYDAGGSPDALFDALQRLLQDDRASPYLSGLSFALLMEAGRAGERYAEAELSRRFSPGIPPAAAAEWFEGLLSRNPYLFLSHRRFWKAVDSYVISLDEPDFRRALAIMRRALATLDAEAKRRLMAILEEDTPSDVGARIGGFKYLDKFDLEELL